MIPATYDASKHYKNPLTATLTLTSPSSSSSSNSLFLHTTNPFAGATTTNMTINSTIKPSAAVGAAASTSSSASSQIPSYYAMGGSSTSSSSYLQRNNSYHKYPHHHHHHLQQQQPSQLPQSTSQCNSKTTSATTINSYQGSNTITTTTQQIKHQVSGAGGLGEFERLPSGSGSSSATSSSPLSPPSITSYNLNRDTDTKLVSEMNKLCRKSPFMPKKINGSTTYNRYQTPPHGGGNGGGVGGNGISGGFNDESPKKESVLTTIGQSILRNLTTSPFSQKKNISEKPSVQPHQIDPLFRMPCPQDNLYDAKDKSTTTPTSAMTMTATTTTAKDSPALQRKRFQLGSDCKYGMTAAKKTNHTDGGGSLEMQQQEKSSSMIPLTKNDAQPQRVPGNHSPLVLQRFYHQQNQLREKEIERQHHQQFSPFYTKQSPSSEITNAFHTNYYQTSLPQQQQLQHYSSHIPIASSSTLSSYSTSSQSSTQSSQCSQIGSADVPQPHTPQGPRSLPLMTTTNENSHKTTLSPISPLLHEATLGFGTTTTATSPIKTTTARHGVAEGEDGHLQYQALPQQYLTNTAYANMIRHSRSPPTSPETLNVSVVTAVENNGVGGGMGHKLNTSPAVTKLSKLYNQRHIPLGSTSATTAGGNANNARGSLKENNLKTESGWFNTLAGAMKRQLSYYVKSQSNNNSPPNSATVVANTAASATNGLSDNKAATNHSETSPDNRKPHFYYQRAMSAGSSSIPAPSNSKTYSPLIDSSSIKGDAESFDEGSSAAGFIRRYAASTGGGGGVGSNSPGPSNSLPATHTPAHILANLDRRHRSPDPPPRYNRGQSPLLLRKNILELSGQPLGTSPLLNRRFVNASPPLPPPRRGSESVPGSPQHFRTRIHYTPEPQRRVYRTIDQ